jgi:membrane protein YdbS with pleckstrin-like domain
LLDSNLLDPDTVSPETTDDFQSLDPHYIRVEQISGLIFAGVVSSGLLIGLLILWLNIGHNWIWFTALGGVASILIGLFYLAFSWPARVYRHAKWRLDEEGLEIHGGVLWQHRISVPMGRVQHADVSQGPLQRMFDIGKLTVNTAGTQNSSVDLDGLTHSLALELRDRIVNQRKATDVV